MNAPPASVAAPPPPTLDSFCASALACRLCLEVQVTGRHGKPTHRASSSAKEDHVDATLVPACAATVLDEYAALALLHIAGVSSSADVVASPSDATQAAALLQASAAWIGPLRHVLQVRSPWDWCAWLHGHKVACDIASLPPRELQKISLGTRQLNTHTWYIRLEAKPRLMARQVPALALQNAYAAAVLKHVTSTASSSAPSPQQRAVAWTDAATRWGACFASVHDMVAACAAIGAVWFGVGTLTVVPPSSRTDGALLDALSYIAQAWICDGVVAASTTPDADAIDVQLPPVLLGVRPPLRPAHVALLSWMSVLARGHTWLQARIQARDAAGADVVRERLRALWHGLMGKAWGFAIGYATAATTTTPGKEAYVQRWAHVALLLACWGGLSVVHAVRRVLPSFRPFTARVIVSYAATAPALLHAALVLSPTPDAVWWDAAVSVDATAAVHAVLAAITTAAGGVPPQAWTADAASSSSSSPAAATATTTTTTSTPPTTPPTAARRAVKAAVSAASPSRPVPPSSPSQQSAAHRTPPHVRAVSAWRRTVTRGYPGLDWDRAFALADTATTVTAEDGTRTVALEPLASYAPATLTSVVVGLAALADKPGVRRSDVALLLQQELAAAVQRSCTAAAVVMLAEHPTTSAAVEQQACRDTQQWLRALAHAWLPMDIVHDALCATSPHAAPFAGMWGEGEERAVAAHDTLPPRLPQPHPAHITLRVDDSDAPLPAATTPPSSSHASPSGGDSSGGGSALKHVCVPMQAFGYTLDAASWAPLPRDAGATGSAASAATAVGEAHPPKARSCRREDGVTREAMVQRAAFGGTPPWASTPPRAPLDAPVITVGEEDDDLDVAALFGAPGPTDDDARWVGDDDAMAALLRACRALEQPPAAALSGNSSRRRQ